MKDAIDVTGDGKGHAKTECLCGKEGKHLTETALQTVFPSTPEKVYNLMFNSGWLKDFMVGDQKLKGGSRYPLLIRRSCCAYIQTSSRPIGNHLRRPRT
jgi:hypothetical protein